MTVLIRGKIRYVAGDTRLAQCPCEPANNPPLWVLLASCVNGIPDSPAVTQVLQNANWSDGDCVVVQGAWLASGGQTLCVNTAVKFIAPCPNGPCAG